MKLKKILAVLLSLAMVLAVVNVPVFATEGDVVTETVETAPTGTTSFAYTKEVDGYVRVWGEAYNLKATESVEFKLYSGESLIATTALNNIGNIIDGDIPELTWNFFYPESNDEYWTTT